MLKGLLIIMLLSGVILNADTPNRISVTKLYLATFDRVPDAEGLEYWLASDLSLEEIAMSFFDQSETKAKYPEGFSHTNFVQAVYKNLFKRDPDDEGLEYWVRSLEDGSVVSSVFILAAINGALGDDARLLNNKVIVGLAFVGAGKNSVLEARRVISNVTVDTNTVRLALNEYKLENSTTSAKTEDDKDSSDTTTPDPTNSRPVAKPQSKTVKENSTANAITLVGTDANNDSLTYAIVSKPTHGTLGGTGSNVTYTPTADYTGSDSFTFTVNDGTASSSSATVTITVTDAPDTNTIPVAKAQNITIAENSTANTIILEGTDADGDALTYRVKTQPTHGQLRGTAPNLNYTPTASYTGADSFTFVVNDDTVDSSSTTVSITVVAEANANHAPVATSQYITIDENSQNNPITLAGTDVDGDALTYRIVTQPENGTLKGTGTNFTYTPTASYSGYEWLYFVVNDGTVDSSQAFIRIEIRSVSFYVFNDDVTFANTQESYGPIDVLDNDRIPSDMSVDMKVLDLPNFYSMDRTYTTEEGTAEVTADNKILFTPSDSFGGGDFTVDYYLSDNNENSSYGAEYGTLTITTPAILVATYDTFEPAQIAATTMNVLENDTYESGNTPTPLFRSWDFDTQEYIYTTEAVEDDGTWKIVDNQVKFTPASNFGGGHVFASYYISDGTHMSTASVIITFPYSFHAENDRIESDTIESKTINVLANDTYESGTNPTLLLENDSTELVKDDGTWNIVDNQVKFTPAADFKGGLTYIIYQIKSGDYISDAYIDIEYPYE